MFGHSYKAMKFIDEYRDSELGKRLVGHIHRHSHKPIRLMEFCGGHTVAIFKHGIRQLLPPTIEMLSGPGCPVCVTANADLDRAIAISKIPGVIVATFGDMLKVPGSYSSLRQAKAEGGDIRIVYSATDALKIARDNPEKSLIFLGIGFETTAPTAAASILEAQKEGLKNYFVLSMHKVCPPVIKAILDSGEIKLDGIISPWHVSAVIGCRPYDFVARDYGIACVVSGFEPLDILFSVAMLVTQIESKQPKVEIAYRRGVRAEGNIRALELMKEVFHTDEANWRGIGAIAESGLAIKEKYKQFDAMRHFPVEIGIPREPKGCICGDILRGVRTPIDCRLFRTHCNPERPLGPCMVSAEGACSTYYLYGNSLGR
jgi:hydrogenase expression/formation protein HypD